MLLHIGEDVAVNSRHIIALLDIGTVMGSRDGRAALRRAQACGQVRKCTLAAKSVIIADTPRGICWYFSGIGTPALRQRLSANAAQPNEETIAGEDQ